MLDVAGAAMVGAEDAEQGLALVEQQDFDVALVDLRMPGMDGLSAIRHIRAREDAKAAMPIIVVTADTAHDLRARCLRRAPTRCCSSRSRWIRCSTRSAGRSEEHTSGLQSLMRISYAVFCLKKKKE